MGGHLSSAYKKRNHPAIKRSAKPFSDALHARDSDKAARIVFRTALEVGGVKMLMNALNQATRVFIRSKLRRGL